MKYIYTNVFDSIICNHICNVFMYFIPTGVKYVIKGSMHTLQNFRYNILAYKRIVQFNLLSCKSVLRSSEKLSWKMYRAGKNKIDLCVIRFQQPYSTISTISM